MNAAQRGSLIAAGRGQQKTSFYPADRLQRGQKFGVIRHEKAPIGDAPNSSRDFKKRRLTLGAVVYRGA